MSSPAWSIRLGTIADVPAITAMHRRNGFTVAQGDPARAEFYFTAVRAAGGEELIAVEGGEVVGHLEFLLCQEAPPSGWYGCLEMLEVRDDRRRQGIGRALVQYAVALTRAAGGTWVEVCTGDDNAPAQALYAGAGFVPGPRMRVLELEVPPDDLEPAAQLGPRLTPGDRPWLRLRHVAGRQLPAPYCWWRAQLAAGWELPHAARTGAWGCGRHPAVSPEGTPETTPVVMAEPWMVHLFLPPAMQPDDAEAWPYWLAMLGLRAEPHGPVRTVLPVELEERLQFLNRWPGRVADEYSVLVRRLT